MIKSVHFIDPVATLQDAHRKMADTKIRHLIVGDPGSRHMVGIISDRDIKKYISPFSTASSATDRDKATLSIEVRRIMIPKVVSAQSADPVKQVVEIMLQKKISCVPILNDEFQVVGIITSTDLMKLLLNSL